MEKRSDCRVDMSGGSSVEQTIWSVNAIRKIKYDIISCEDVFNPDNHLLALNNKGIKQGKRFIIVDSFVYNHYIDKINWYFDSHQLRTKIICFESSEYRKSVESFLWIFKELDEFDVDRRGDPLIAIGGGVLTDIAGFVSSTYRRGIPHIKVPTTLMGYIDASVGIKTGINFNTGKNRMGTFDPPMMVLLDKFFLSTLPIREITNGLGEILKIAVIKDIYLLSLLEDVGMLSIKTNFQNYGDEILKRSISMMIEELEPNLYEINLQRSVDFGHTFSPALEMKEIHDLKHGEAVSVDIAFSLILAVNRGLLTRCDAARVFSIMKQLNIPYKHYAAKPDLLWSSVIERTHHRDGYQRIPLPSPLGSCVFIDDLTKEEIDNACLLMEDM